MVLDWMINDEKGFFRNKTDVITFFNYNLNTFIIFELLYILLTALISCLLISIRHAILATVFRFTNIIINCFAQHRITIFFLYNNVKTSSG